MFDEEDFTYVQVTGLVRDEGTIVVLEGTNDEGETVRFACDHRPAQDIINALEAGQDPEAAVASWQFVGGV